ncbi:hypothetical protein CA54_16920 [Symmachiella macrocystis]|uniref:Uncharacterized protein n=1 Tax=Symmachiella macrocystis TaxID=2527985 RepID=A0A5C6BNI0_9PLAN|nr:hypothetical protein CA54_16920 [Symmachiella macrocystis]
MQSEWKSNSGEKIPPAMRVRILFGGGFNAKRVGSGGLTSIMKTDPPRMRRRAQFRKTAGIRIVNRKTALRAAGLCCRC